MNVKSGDIAIVIAGVPENLGRLVHVEREHGMVDYTHKGYGLLHCWVVRPVDGLARNAYGDLVSLGYIPDLALRALPKPTPREQLDEGMDELGEVMKSLAERIPEDCK